MRSGLNSKRSRNQRNNMRRGGGGSQNRSHTFDSNGPEVKLRGSASQIFEKYLALARDANSSGDRIKAENFQQHAEHYYRIVNNANNSNGSAQQRPYPPQVGESSNLPGEDAEVDGGEDQGEAGETPA